MNTLNKLTLEKCFEIVEKNDSFLYKEEIIEGQKVYQFNYRLASSTDFIKPIENDDIEAFELRGLTFVEQKNGEYKRFLLLHKFFNINETGGLNGEYSYLQEDCVDFEIIRVQDKLDGSLIRFIPFENGKVLAKTKMSFQSEQSAMAQKIYDNDEKYQNFIKECFENNLSPSFEITSPDNQIVLKYHVTSLKLLQIRNEETGEYLDIYNNELVSKHDIPTTESKEIHSLDWFLETREFIKGIEGWVHTLFNKKTNQTMMWKVKTKEYFDLHKIMSPETIREHDVINSIINETIDDVISQFHEKEGEITDVAESLKTKREWIEEINKLVSHYINTNADLAYNIVKLELDPNDKKSFAIKHKTHPLFGVMMSLTKENNKELAEKLMKNYVAKNYAKLSTAKNWLEKLRKN